MQRICVFRNHLLRLALIALTVAAVTRDTSAQQAESQAGLAGIDPAGHVEYLCNPQYFIPEDIADVGGFCAALASPAEGPQGESARAVWSHLSAAARRDVSTIARLVDSRDPADVEQRVQLTKRRTADLVHALNRLLSGPALAVGDSPQDGASELARHMANRGVLAAAFPEHLGPVQGSVSRFTGYPGADRAAEYIAAKFDEIGLTNLKEDIFQVVVPIVPRDAVGRRPDHGAELAIGESGPSLPLYCLMPNYVRTPQTAEKGRTGRLIWAGDGFLEDFNGKEVEGAIVLMRFNTMTRWLNAAKLGAAAIVFLEPEFPFRADAEQKYSELPIPVPRYYMKRGTLEAMVEAILPGTSADEGGAQKALGRLGLPVAEQVRRELAARGRDVHDASGAPMSDEDVLALGAEVLGQEALSTMEKLADVSVNVMGRMRWEEVNVRRISAEIPGTDPQLSEQTIVVFGYYDSTSVVPALSPGAESACGVAAMLETARYLVANPPRRTVKFMAAPGHYQAMSGVRDYAARTIYPRRAEDAKAGVGTGEPYFFIGLDLSSRHNSMGAFFKGHFYDQLGTNEAELRRSYSELSGMITQWSDQVTGSGGAAESLTYHSGIVPERGREWRSLVPDLVAFDSEVISLCGYPGITLATTGDPRNSVNTPLDEFDNMLGAFLDNVRRQAALSAHVIKSTADLPILPVQRDKVWAKAEVGTLFGYAIELSLLAYMPKVPVPNTIAAVSMLRPGIAARSKSMMGVSTYDFSQSNTQGFFEVFGLCNKLKYRVDGFELSETSGVVRKVANSELPTATNRARARDWAERETDVRLNFFRAVSTTIFDLTDALSLRTLGQSTALTGESNSDLQYLVPYVGQESASDGFSKPCAVFFTERDKNIKFVLTSGGTGYQGLLLNFAAEEHDDDARKERTGIGYKAEKNENFIYRTAYHIARDMHGLDAYRMARLEQAGISKAGVNAIFDEAESDLQRAGEALEAKQYDDFYHFARMAWGRENAVYPDVRDTATDVVKGVIFYFALLLPFVIFAERLLINYVDIRKKLVAIAVLFCISYMVLRVVHPAFELSRTPIIILNGFFMLVAAAGTIWYLVGRFGIVMENIQRKVDTIHRADVARAAATMAAFVLGISNMRKRKVRTTLTAVTLILLTFTILSFTSFESRPSAVLDHASDRDAPYEGVLLRSLTWAPLAEFVTYDMRNFFLPQGMNVSERSWFVNRNRQEELQIEVSRADGRAGSTVANALLGLSPEEKHFTNVFEMVDPDSGARIYKGEPFDRSLPDWPFVAILPKRMQETLGISPDEIEAGTAYVTMLGSRKLRVIGTFESDSLFRVTDLDGEPILPVDFVAQAARQGSGTQQQGGGLSLSATGAQDVESFVHSRTAKQEEEEQYVHMEPDRALVIPHELNISLGGTVRSVAAGPGVAPSPEEKTLRPFVRVLEDDLLKRVNLAVYAGYTDPVEMATNESETLPTPKVHRMATRSSLSVGGMKGLLVPIMIAALIVFNTMLGAVYERMNEIRTYASVGLAPMHIGALFFAESSVFAVMGAMLGYLLGQVLSYVLAAFPSLAENISLNYSSVSAVWSALLVMVVVLLSTAYPARMAGKLSVPDETRKMAIPRPTSDRWEIWFPFTVSSKETLGVMSYLREYFIGNSEDAVGSFTAGNITFYTERREGYEQDILCLGSDVWVAPLDMGVSQHVEIASVPDKEEGEITYLFFTITRKSGEFQTWHRMNLGFLKDLRKQLLIWRLVTPEAKARLTEEGRALLGKEGEEE